VGDRANIHVIADGETEGVWLYTHWKGYKIHQILKTALIRGRERWDDSQYLARIIFCEMIKDNIMGLTGYGISSQIHDNDRAIIHVYSDKQTILIKDKLRTFEEFITEDYAEEDDIIK